MANRKSSVAQYPLPQQSVEIVEIPEAQVISEEDYLGNFDALGNKKSGSHTSAANTASSAAPRRTSTASVTQASSSGRQPLPSAAASLETSVEAHSYAFKPWPPRLQAKIVESFGRPLQERRGREFLQQNHWPIGLQSGLIRSCQKYPLRYFIVDDSGSMSTSDGRRVAGTGKQARVVSCTRWAELVSGLNFLVELSEKLGVVSEVRLLNGADPCIVGLGDDNGDGLQFAKTSFSESPGGQTPLCQHICAVVASLTLVADDLRRLNKKAVVIICTDGESTDGDVAVAMRPLKSLPAWVVLRICTAEPKVLQYWNDIDSQLELELDVIDDMISEANEVKQFNNWLTYGEPLQRYREFGAFMKELDLVDEQALSGDQLSTVCGTLFLEKDPTSFPHPDVDWRQFANALYEGTVSSFAETNVRALCFAALLVRINHG